MQNPQELAQVANQEYSKGQLANLKLENEKLKLEIQRLERRDSVGDKIEKFIPLITVLLAIAGFWWGGFTYFRDERVAREKYEAEQRDRWENVQLEIQRANDSRELELRKPFWEKQLELYFAASEAAATIATSNNPSDKRAAEAKFWVYYWGSLAIVEDAGMKKPEDAVVEGAMVRFGFCLDGKEACDADELKQRSLSLAHRCRESVGKSWDVKFADLTGSKTNQ